LESDRKFFRWISGEGETEGLVERGAVEIEDGFNEFSIEDGAVEYPAVSEEGGKQGQGNRPEGPDTPHQKEDTPSENSDSVVEGEAGFLDILAGIFGKEEPKTGPTDDRI